MEARPAHLVARYAPAREDPERISYRIAELAKATGVPRRTLHDRCNSGALDCRKDGRNVYMMAESVIRWFGSLPAVSDSTLP